MNDERVKADLPAGFHDYLPREMIVRNAMIEKIRRVFECFGFDPLETPAIERKVVLTGGETTAMRIYNVRAQDEVVVTDERSPIPLALRFDLTVPLARVVAEHLGIGEGQERALRLPFRRYQIGNVWRGEKPQAGRFREFLQCDADACGTEAPVADAEIVALMVATLRVLDVPRFVVKMNDRKLLNGLAAYAGFDPAYTADVLRILDKFMKIGRDGVLRELQKPPRPATAHVREGEEDEESDYGLGLSADVADRIGNFLDCSGGTDDLLDQCTSLFTGVATAEEGIAELRAIVHALRAMAVPEQYWAFDPAVARGLGYYTGPVFETFLLHEDGSTIERMHTDDAGTKTVERFGSVFSGGRYDGLVSRFSDANIPATGASIGVDRLFDQLVKLDRITLTPTLVQVLVTVMDQQFLDDYYAITATLRDAGIRTMLWTGTETTFKSQMAYAAAQEIPVLVIMGGDEQAAGTVTIRDMATRSQEASPRGALVETIQRMLGRAWVVAHNN
ncbi:MAG: histidine--tRNA ligase [bacterium]|nr:histidine--tRNA ligase [bacterium]